MKNAIETAFAALLILSLAFVTLLACVLVRPIGIIIERSAKRSK